MGGANDSTDTALGPAPVQAVTATLDPQCIRAKVVLRIAPMMLGNSVGNPEVATSTHRADETDAAAQEDASDA